MSTVTNREWKAEIGPVLGKPTALIAEDDPGTREALGRILDRMGFVVFHAGSIAEAVAGAERYPGRLDLLVAGSLLPDGPGDRLVRRLDRLDYEPSVLYLIPRDRADVVPRGLSAPNASAVVKPVHRRAIASELSALFALDGRTSRAGSG